MPKILLNSQQSDHDLPAPRKLFDPEKSKNNIEKSQFDSPKGKEKVQQAIERLFKNRSYVNLSFSQKSILKKPREKQKNLSNISTKDLRFDPRYF